MNRDLARRINRIERPDIEGRTIVLFVYGEEDRARQLAEAAPGAKDALVIFRTSYEDKPAMHGGEEAQCC
jgi:hypothetical protein